MHILFLPSWYPTLEQPLLGRFFQEQIHLLASRGIQAGVVFTEDRSLRFLTPKQIYANHFQVCMSHEDNIFVIRQNGWRIIPFDNLLYTKFWAKQTLKLIAHYINACGKPDLLHSFVAHPSGYAASLSGLPYVVSEHSSIYLQDLVKPWQKNLIRSTYRNANAITAVSDILATAIQPYSQRPIDVIPNYIDTEFFSLPVEPRKISPYVFLAIGNLVKVKGFNILLQAFCQVLKVVPNAILRIGGIGPERASLESVATELNIQDRVFFLGQLSREEVRNEMWRANTFVVSSYHETFSIVIIEALATGLPVIATRSGGPEEIVKSGVGTLVNVKDISDLTENMVKATTTYFEPKSLRRYVVENYSVKVVTQKIMAIYNDILGG